MKHADAVYAVDTFIRILAEDINFHLDAGPHGAPSHRAFRQKCIDTLAGALEVCPENTKHFFGHGHVYSHASWGNTNCVYCGKAKP